MSCQCKKKKKNELHITATNNNNGTIKTRSVEASQPSWEKKNMRQYSGFIIHWMPAATISYMQMSN